MASAAEAGPSSSSLLPPSRPSAPALPSASAPRLLSGAEIAHNFERFVTADVRAICGELSRLSAQHEPVAEMTAVLRDLSATISTSAGAIDEASASLAAGAPRAAPRSARAAAARRALDA